VAGAPTYDGSYNEIEIAVNIAVAELQHCSLELRMGANEGTIAVFVPQMSTTCTVTPLNNVLVGLSGDSQGCRVFWQRLSARVLEQLQNRIIAGSTGP